MGDHRGVRSREFFRIKLLRATRPEQVRALLDDMEHEQIQMLDQMFEIGWHLRGFVNYDHAWGMSQIERVRALKYIEGRLKLVEKTRMPII
jgi:hypothetical protein